MRTPSLLGHSIDIDLGRLNMWGGMYVGLTLFQ
jgi:hypothetical protein